MTDLEFSVPRMAEARRFRRSVLPVVAALAALGLAACEPPPPPDGRDLGLVLDTPAPTRVEKGEVVELSGTVTNHGTAPAVGAKVAYAVTGGFTVEEIDLGGAATCAPVSATQTGCTLNEPLGAGESLSLTIRSTAGQVSGAHTHLVGAGSDGTEPSPDENPGFVVFTVDVRPAPAASRPLEIGNGTNYLGTGDLVGSSGSGRAAEGLSLSVNTFCAAKANGDRFQAAFNPATPNGQCSGPVNAEYRQSGYTYAIDVPPGRTSELEVLLWDARYNWNGEGATDMRLGSAGFEPFTFSLYSADATPLNDGDNPLLCSKTFNSDDAFDHGPYLGSDRWNELCSIPTSAPSGRYLLRVRNGGAATSPVADGSNQFGVVAAYASAGGDPVTSLCDRSTRADCPVVSGPGEASIWIGTDAAVARVPLGGIDADQEGRRLRVELFDPGEGMESLRLLAPAGVGAWVPVEFTWTSPGLSGPVSTTTWLDVRNSRFNGRLVTIDVDLAGYQPLPGNDQWLVEYRAQPGVPVTDRTTWSAWVEDQP